MAQNRSNAVMATRIEPKDSRDDFPTQPWATRAMVKFGLIRVTHNPLMTCLEPACGRGHMVRALADTRAFSVITASDKYRYGKFAARKSDFLTANDIERADWIITNPPFKHAEEFVLKALDLALTGVAIIARSSFGEGTGRYARLFSKQPPSYVLQFTERVPMFRGRISGKGSTATAYAWFVWDKTDHVVDTRYRWIPPCRKRLERPGDYD